MNWTWLLNDFRAASDFPICWYYREILGAFPNAKVVLSVREPQSWALSVQALHKAAFLAIASRPSMQSGLGRVWVETVKALVWDRLGDMSDVGALCRVYEHHVASVREHVPAQQLLMFSVKEGWPPLCEFLGRHVPPSEFPHLNERSDLRSVAANV